MLITDERNKCVETKMVFPCQLTMEFNIERDSIF